MCHTDMSTPAWISTNHKGRENDGKERRGRACKGGVSSGLCNQKEEMEDMLLRSVTVHVLGWDKAGGMSSSLEVRVKGLEAQSARPGNCQVRTGSRSYTRCKMDRIKGRQMQTQGQAKGRSQVTRVSQT